MLIKDWYFMVKRKGFSKKVKEEELRRAKYHCRKCKKKLGYPCFEFNHKNDKKSDNSQNNCQVLCLCCHRKITMKQIKGIPKKEFVRRAKKAWITIRKSKKIMKYIQDE